MSKFGERTEKFVLRMDVGGIRGISNCRRKFKEFGVNCALLLVVVVVVVVVVVMVVVVVVVVA